MSNDLQTATEPQITKAEIEVNTNVETTNKTETNLTLMAEKLEALFNQYEKNITKLAEMSDWNELLHTGMLPSNLNGGDVQLVMDATKFSDMEVSVKVPAKELKYYNGISSTKMLSAAIPITGLSKKVTLRDLLTVKIKASLN
ncbi:hypothetical protein RFI_23827 [Reticulomyxa filosa]|uniref:Uncharacterized protein n=1 Tax=Reticulomyxa filosa TaxID=46433 RepID=X6MIP1_RETFI|nr:hypothetical protein RFI_23827 [Reticulomyxa filosa]|eukprot:ETO13531.1 hypothetical protein RFI_23827 [Reticulomyxa filosa]